MNKEIIEKVLKPYGILRDERVTRLCMLKALQLQEEEIKKKVDKLIIGDLYGMKLDTDDYDKIVKKWEELKNSLFGEENKKWQKKLQEKNLERN